MPSALNTRAVNHSVFAQQPSGFIPLAADSMQQAIQIAFLVRQNTIFVPDANNTMSATVAQRHYFTQLAIPMKGFFNRSFHKPCNVSFSNNPI